MASMSSMIVELRDKLNRSLRNELKVDKPKDALTRASYKYNMWAERQVRRMPVTRGARFPWIQSSESDDFQVLKMFP